MHKQYDRAESSCDVFGKRPIITFIIVCKLKDVLKRKGWTRYRLHKETGITYPTLHAKFHNRSKLYSAALLEKIGRALRCQQEICL
jgi:hypothetical protein